MNQRLLETFPEDVARELLFERLPQVLFTKGPNVVTDVLKEQGVDPEIIKYVQDTVNKAAVRTLEPFIIELAVPEDVELIKMYMKVGLGLMSQSDFVTEAMAMGYNVHGREEGQRAEVPDLSGYMPEIADAFEGYLR